MSRAPGHLKLDSSSLRRAAAFASCASEWLVLAYLLIVVTPPVLFHHRAVSFVRFVNMLDGSWLLDTSYKASGGIWFGRDVAFTYGPLFQWLSSAPARCIGVSTGTIYATWYTLPAYLVILATFAAARLLLPETAAWRRAVLVWLAVVYWTAPDLRISLAVLGFIVMVRLTDGAASPGGESFLAALAAAGLCATAFLLSADTGLYCVAAVLLCVAATAAAKRRVAEMAVYLGQATVAFGVMVVAINAWMSSPLDFRFWRSSLAIALGYRWFEPLGMSKSSKHLLLAILALGMAVFALAAGWRRPRCSWTARPAFLLAGFFFALGTLQSALVRSDVGHVRIGIYCLVFLCAAIAMDRFSAGWQGVLSAAIVAAVTVGFVKDPLFRPSEVISNLKRVAYAPVTCQAGQDLDRACLIPSDARALAEVSSYVNSRLHEDDPMAVVSYDTAFGLLSRHQVAGGVMQSYLVNGGYLTALQLQGLEKAKPQLALNSPEPLVDFVPTLTRNADLWLYYLRHYRLDESSPSRIGLLRDETREGRIRLTSEKVSNALPAKRLLRRSTTFDLGPVHWPDGADFLKLRVRVDYPFWWLLRKPSAYTLQITCADGCQRSIQFVVQPGHTTDIWVYPWADETLASYFSSDESQWRVANRPAATGLKLLVTPHDWISVVPKSVSVESIEAVRVDLQ